MIYIGIVIASLMLIGLSTWQIKKKARLEAEFINGLKGRTFVIENSIAPQPALSGLGNSISLAGRIWSINITHPIEAGQAVRIDFAASGSLTLGEVPERVATVTSIQQAA